MLSKKKMKEISYDVIGKIFSTLGKALWIKLSMVKRRPELHGRRAEILDELSTTTSSARVQELMIELDSIEDKVEETEKVQCWQSRASSQYEANRFYLATTYQDTWVKIQHRGQIVASFMSWFLCGAKLGDGSVCATLTASKRWIRSHADPLASGMRYYCSSCGARYRPKYGLLVELFELESAGRAYALAEFNADMLDVKGIDMELRLGDSVSTPEQLFAAIPDVLPVDTQVLRPLRAEEYDYRAEKGFSFKVVDYPLMARLPKWSWDQLWRYARE
jgi:hypothetical protein